jgi:hypothetical protein
MAVKAIDMTFGDPSKAIHDWYRILLAGIYFVDVCIAATGYLATLRLFGWHIRSCSPFPVAWLVTFVCYYPFFGYLYRNLLSYNDDGYTWKLWFGRLSHCSRFLGWCDRCPEVGLDLVYRTVWTALFELDQPRNHDEWSVPLFKAPELHFQKPILVAYCSSLRFSFRSVVRRCQFVAARCHWGDLLSSCPI